MDSLISFVVGAIIMGLLFINLPDWNASTTYPMMVKAEKTCYSNQGIKNVAKRAGGDGMLVVNCNNGAQFKFTEEEYRNE